MRRAPMYRAAYQLSERLEILTPERELAAWTNSPPPMYMPTWEADEPLPKKTRSPGIRLS